MKPTATPSSTTDLPALRQVGALPIRFADNGEAEVLLLTSRETKRWVIPKGWPMKGKTKWRAAAQEALEEAGIVGRVRKKPVGSFLYFKRQLARFDLCRVEVFILDYQRQVGSYREKGQREMRWFPLGEAAELVDESGLAALIKGLTAKTLSPPKPGKRG
jgi:8-oxo-dGTP pyrophosphatase MutT (NUDIX family)